MKLIPFLFIVSFLFSCHKGDGAISPKDSTATPYPYEVSYHGMLHAYESYIDTAYDTVYSESLLVTRIDTSTLRFHLSFWSFNENGTSYFKQYHYDHAIVSSGRYADSIHDHKIIYTLIGDSLNIYLKDFLGGFHDRVIIFGGK